jgi:hypothetical protein
VNEPADIKTWGASDAVHVHRGADEAVAHSSRVSGPQVWWSVSPVAIPLARIVARRDQGDDLTGWCEVAVLPRAKRINVSIITITSA